MRSARTSCGGLPPCQGCRKPSCNGWGWVLIYTGSLKFRIWRVDRANGELYSSSMCSALRLHLTAIPCNACSSVCWRNSLPALHAVLWYAPCAVQCDHKTSLVPLRCFLAVSLAHCSCVLCCCILCG